MVRTIARSNFPAELAVDEDFKAAHLLRLKIHRHVRKGPKADIQTYSGLDYAGSRRLRPLLDAVDVVDQPLVEEVDHGADGGIVAHALVGQ